LRFRRFIRQDAFAAVFFLAPSVIGFAIFYAVPFIASVVYSFVDSPVKGSFVGLDNYRELFLSPSFRKAGSNTFVFTAISVPLMLALSLWIAIMLNQRVYFLKWLRTSYVLPLVVPAASVVFIWQIIFDWNGTMNGWLYRLGVEQVDWMKSDWALGAVTSIYLWKNLGYNIILLLAGLLSIPKDYYETADLEGAGAIRKLTGITLVYLMPTIFFVSFMSIINSFKVFRETYLLAGSYPHDRIYMMQHYMNNVFQELDIQKLSAASVVMVGCILIFVWMLLMMDRRFRAFTE